MTFIQIYTMSFTAHVMLCYSLPGDAKHVTADLPKSLGQVVIRSSPRAPRRRTVTEHTQGQRMAITHCVLCLFDFYVKDEFINPQIHTA